MLITLPYNTPEERLIIINKVMPMLVKKRLKNHPRLNFFHMELDRDVFLANRKFDLEKYPLNRLNHIPRVEVLHLNIPSGPYSYGLHLIHKIYQQKIVYLLKILNDPCYNVEVGVIPTYSNLNNRFCF
jgi:hypothetical protein